MIAWLRGLWGCIVLFLVLCFGVPLVVGWYKLQNYRDRNKQPLRSNNGSSN